MGGIFGTASSLNVPRAHCAGGTNVVYYEATNEGSADTHRRLFGISSEES
jgi:hypothetical protein